MLKESVKVDIVSQETYTKSTKIYRKYPSKIEIGKAGQRDHHQDPHIYIFLFHNYDSNFEK